MALRPVPELSLLLVTSGPIPPNPADLLDTDRFKTLVQEISETMDVLLIDSPPALAVTDPLIVAAATDAVLLVVHSDSTRVDVLERAAQSLRQAGARLAGVVINQHTARGGEGAYYYYGEYGLEKPPKAGR